jgi:hypothetical protein
MGVEGPSQASFARSCLRTIAGCAWMCCYGVSDAPFGELGLRPEGK